MLWEKKKIHCLRRQQGYDMSNQSIKVALMNLLDGLPACPAFAHSAGAFVTHKWSLMQPQSRKLCHITSSFHSSFYWNKAERKRLNSRRLQTKKSWIVQSQSQHKCGFGWVAFEVDLNQGGGIFHGRLTNSSLVWQFLHSYKSTCTHTHTHTHTHTMYILYMLVPEWDLGLGGQFWKWL